MTIIGENYIRFDWAMKRLLRNKANHAVLEGFLSSLIGKKFKIQRFLESESNQEDETDKYNRVDILAENENGELCIIEVQNNRELTYFHRMLYGVSKAITEYIGLGSPYDEVRKVYSINIVYFELGQGKTMCITARQNLGVRMNHMTSLNSPSVRTRSSSVSMSGAL